MVFNLQSKDIRQNSRKGMWIICWKKKLITYIHIHIISHTECNQFAIYAHTHTYITEMIRSFGIVIWIYIILILFVIFNNAIFFFQWSKFLTKFDSFKRKIHGSRMIILNIFLICCRSRIRWKRNNT